MNASLIVEPLVSAVLSTAPAAAEEIYNFASIGMRVEVHQ